MAATHIKGDMTVGNPLKALLIFTLPMVLGNLFQQFYNIVDSVIVGKFVGEDALAAVGASAAITALFIMVANGTGIGFSVIISKLFGSHDLKKTKTAINTALISIFVTSVFFSIIGLMANNAILRFILTPENIFSDAADYLRIYFFGFVFLFMYNGTSAIFNALGDSKKPLIFLIISSILNIFLDMLFVLKFNMGIKGVAWATLIAQTLSFVLSFSFLSMKVRRLYSDKCPLFDFRILRSMVTVAVPTVLQQSIISVGMLLIQSVVNRFGSSLLAGYTAAMKLDGIAIIPMVAVGNAASTYVAQNIGAKKYERIGRGYIICMCMSMLIGVSIALIMAFFGNPMLHWFLDSEASALSLEFGMSYLKTVSIFYFIMGIMNVSCGVLRGAADMKWFLGASLLNLISRVSLCYIFADIVGARIIYWSHPVGWFIALVISVARYFHGGWIKNSKTL